YWPSSECAPLRWMSIWMSSVGWLVRRAESTAAANPAMTGSSGPEALDQAACAKLMLRGRFEPASDSTGALVAGSYTGAVRWQLPKD
ncbi:MAG: energy transducer TonB, partial [Novosphingobium sp.]